MIISFVNWRNFLVR